MLLDSWTTDPVPGAKPLRVTVPVVELPPAKLAGLRTKPTKAGGFTVTVAVCETVLKVAVTSADAWEETGTAVAVNVALLCPAGTVTELGTVRAVFPLDKATTNPPVAVGALSVTVPVVGLPPSKEDGEKVKDTREGGLTVRAALFDTPPAVAAIVATTWALTGAVVVVKVAVVWPAVTVTLAGTDAAGFVLERVTTAPPAGAAAFNVTVPVEAVPPVTDVGLTVTEVGVTPR